MIKVKCICSSNICMLEDHINEFLEEIHKSEDMVFVGMKVLSENKVIILYKKVKYKDISIFLRNEKRK